MLFAELLTAATAEAASELESADEPPPGTAIPAEWGLAMRIVVSDEWRMNSEKFVPNVTKKTSSQVYNSVMHTLSIYTENTGNHCILTPFSFLRGAAFAWGSNFCPSPRVPRYFLRAPTYPRAHPGLPARRGGWLKTLADAPARHVQAIFPQG